MTRSSETQLTPERHFKMFYTWTVNHSHPQVFSVIQQPSITLFSWLSVQYLGHILTGQHYTLNGEYAIFYSGWSRRNSNSHFSVIGWDTCQSEPIRCESPHGAFILRTCPQTHIRRRLMISAQLNCLCLDFFDFLLVERHRRVFPFTPIESLERHVMESRGTAAVQLWLSRGDVTSCKLCDCSLSRSRLMFLN